MDFASFFDLDNASLGILSAQDQKATGQPVAFW
jgi:hypothetical protein